MMASPMSLETAKWPRATSNITETEGDFDQIDPKTLADLSSLPKNVLWQSHLS